MSNQNFFDMSPKQSLVMGLLGGISLVSVIALIVVLAGGQLGAGGTELTNADVNANVNTNANVNANTNAAVQAVADVSKLMQVVDEKYMVGPKDAKVTIIEASDFQCPYCLRHAPTMERIMEEYDGQVRRGWINLPLTSIHPYAQKAAEAAECAGEQNKFWEMHDLLFANQSALDVASLKSYAKNLGLNQSQFDSCLDDGKYASKVQTQAQAAQQAGVTGTPGTFVNNILIKGAYPFETFQQVIDAELAK